MKINTEGEATRDEDEIKDSFIEQRTDNKADHEKSAGYLKDRLDKNEATADEMAGKEPQDATAEPEVSSSMSKSSRDANRHAVKKASTAAKRHAATSALEKSSTGAMEKATFSVHRMAEGALHKDQDDGFDHDYNKKMPKKAEAAEEVGGRTVVRKTGQAGRRSSGRPVVRTKHKGGKEKQGGRPVVQTPYKSGKEKQGPGRTQHNSRTAEQNHLRRTGKELDSGVCSKYNLDRYKEVEYGYYQMKLCICDCKCEWDPEEEKGKRCKRSDAREEQRQPKINVAKAKFKMGKSCQSQIQDTKFYIALPFERGYGKHCGTLYKYNETLFKYHQTKPEKNYASTCGGSECKRPDGSNIYGIVKGKTIW